MVMNGKPYMILNLWSILFKDDNEIYMAFVGKARVYTTISVK